MANIELGKVSEYKDEYDASLLEPIPRAVSRESLAGAPVSLGYDLWNAYELSWLNAKGKPELAIAEFKVPAHSQNIIESKSFKYYLNSFNQTHYESRSELEQRLRADLSEVAGAEVGVSLYALESNLPVIDVLPGRCVDGLDVEIETYQPSADLLQHLDHAVHVQDRQVFSHLLKSNCPVTGQPDWASVWVEYSGLEVCETSFLRYVVAFRQYQGFHESCVERIYADLMAQLSLTELRVYARYTRRGGLDINPYRVSEGMLERALPFKRLVRQ